MGRSPVVDVQRMNLQQIDQARNQLAFRRVNCLTSPAMEDAFERIHQVLEQAQEDAQQREQEGTLRDAGAQAGQSGPQEIPPE